MARRMLLKAAAIAPLALTRAGGLFAAPSSGAKLLIVFLRGGYDAANLLVPVSSAFYYESRPNIAVPKPGGDAKAAIALDSDWGLHPALGASIHPLFAKKQVAFVPFAGTEDLSRSHFETQDSIELGQPLGGQRDFRSGFLNRLVRSQSDPAGMSFTDQLPLLFRSELERTFRANGNRGTDHGNGTVYWVMGGGIRGGSVIGEQVRVERSTLLQDRDYPVLNEYLAILAGLAGRMFGLDKARLQQVFP